MIKKQIIIRLAILSLGFFSSLAKAQENEPQGFFLDDWKAKNAVSPAYVLADQTTETATVTITVDLKDTISRVSKYVFGNNAVNWAGKMNKKTGLVESISCLQPNVLRWPGGNLSNEHFWDAVQDQGPEDIPPTLNVGPLQAGMNTSNWAMTLDEYYDLREQTNSEGCICINYSYARYGTGPDPLATAAHHAANWVRYDSGRTRFWEIGNENQGPWEAGYEIDTSLNQDGQPKIISGELYGQHCRVFIDSMKSAASEVGADIKIGIGLQQDLVTWNDVMNKWNSGVLAQAADMADFLIVHSYYTPYDDNSGIATILNSAANTKNYKNYVLKDLKTYGGMDNLPVALTEWNIFAVGSMQAVSYINGMHASLVLGELIKNQYGQAMRWDLANGWSDGDDHGLFAREDEPGVTEDTPHAPFYYMYFFQKYFGDHMVASTVVGNSNVVSYASSFSSGESGLVIVNKGTTQQTVNLKMENYPDAKSYYRYVLTGGTDNGDFSRKVYVNGEGPAMEGGGPENYKTLEALGNGINGGIKFDLPPLSVSYVLVSPDSIQDFTGIETRNRPSVHIFPNPSNGEFTIQSAGFEYRQLEVLTLEGKKVAERLCDDPVRENALYHFNLASGAYILKLSNGKQQVSELMIIR